MIKVRVLTEDGGLDYEHCSDSDLIRVYDTEFQDAVLEADAGQVIQLIGDDRVYSEVIK